MTKPTEKTQEHRTVVKYCVTGFTDLRGFSSHLEVGRNDLRTTVGRAAIDRLRILETALDMMERERSSCRQEYPSVFHHQRLNDAIFYTLDLPDFFMPAIGESIKKGVSVKEISETFDLDSFETVDEFTRAYESKVETDITNLMKFVGLIARMHSYINHEDNALFFPGARTVIAAGYRSRFFSDEQEDFFLG